MVQDLKFFFKIFFFHYGSGLRIFFPQKFLSHGSGLWIFFPNNNSSLWLRTWDFFHKKFFTMVQDLKFFLHFFFQTTLLHYAAGLRIFWKKFSHYGSGLRFFFSILFHYGSGLKFFSHRNIFTIAQDLDFFLQKFLYHGSRLWIFYPNNNSSLWLRT